MDNLSIEKEISDLEVFSRSGSLDVLTWNKDLYRKILVSVFKAIPEHLQHLHELEDSQNFQSIKDEAHKMFGTVCYLKFPRLEFVISRLNQLAKSGLLERNGILELLNVLYQEIEKAMEVLESEISNSKEE